MTANERDANAVIVISPTIADDSEEASEATRRGRALARRLLLDLEQRLKAANEDATALK